MTECDFEAHFILFYLRIPVKNIICENTRTNLLPNKLIREQRNHWLDILRTLGGLGTIATHVCPLVYGYIASVERYTFTLM